MHIPAFSITVYIMEDISMLYIYIVMQKDRMMADMGIELQPHGVTCISLWPGAVLTETIADAINSSKGTVSFFS